MPPSWLDFAKQAVDERLARARRRRDSSLPYSPEWAAAVDEVEELEALLATRGEATDASGARPAGAPAA